MVTVLAPRSATYTRPNGSVPSIAIPYGWLPVGTAATATVPPRESGMVVRDGVGMGVGGAGVPGAADAAGYGEARGAPDAAAGATAADAAGGAEASAGTEVVGPGDPPSEPVAGATAPGATGAAPPGDGDVGADATGEPPGVAIVGAT